MTENEKFIQHLNKAKERVNSWPEWKKQYSNSQIQASENKANIHHSISKDNLVSNKQR